ncbi:MAG TPA: RDD family protein [Gammaproteobacteria bacterium]|nr:RDD family protein [Gammaproteobacteria bacterium]
MHSETRPTPTYAGLFRRLFAIFYDAFLLLAILFIVSAFANALNQGQAIQPGDTFYPLYVFSLFLLAYLYFAWFWIHGGQTLGMKTWRIRLVSENGYPVTWKTAAIRYLTAMLSWGLCCLGFLWALFDSKKRSWHDIISGTVLLDLREKNQG